MLTLTRNPFVPIGALRREMDRLFEQAFESPGTRWLPGRGTFPPLNLWENPDSVILEAELPGVTLDDLEVTVHGQELTLSGKISAAAPEGATYHRRERETGTFKRVVQLPFAMDSDAVQASLQNGALTLTLPKPAEVRPRKIAVRQRT